MAQETWMVVAVGAGFLLLGIAASPLAWVALLHRRSLADRETERLAREMNDRWRSLRARVERCEAAGRSSREPGAAADWLAMPGATTPAPHATIGRRGTGRAAGTPTSDVEEPRLIAVPRLPAPADRPAMQGGLSQRYAAIWELAESGASPDAIARATGQPIGQIELILGLRRQIDAHRTTIPHASHE